MEYPLLGEVIEESLCAGVPGSQDNPPSWEPTVGLYLGSYGGPMGGGLFLMNEVPL